jgi:hypothetical protein
MKQSHQIAILILSLLTFTTFASENQSDSLFDDKIGVPMRLHNNTVPSLLVLGLTAAPDASLGKSRSAFEFHI